MAANGNPQPSDPKRAFSRDWVVGPDETGEVDLAELAETLQEVLTMLRRVGGVFNIGASRQRIGEFEYVTDGVIVQYNSYSPAGSERKQDDLNPERPKPEPDEEPKPEPVEAQIGG